MTGCVTTLRRVNMRTRLSRVSARNPRKGTALWAYHLLWTFPVSRTFLACMTACCTAMVGRSALRARNRAHHLLTLGLPQVGHLICGEATTRPFHYGSHGGLYCRNSTRKEQKNKQERLNNWICTYYLYTDHMNAGFCR